MTRPRLSFTGVALVLTLAVAAAIVVFSLRLPGRSESAALAPVPIGGPFTLTGAGGRRVSDQDLLGKPFAIFFGYTHCPDVCPTTLAEIDVARDTIGPAADALTVIFVSVDPERDDPDMLQGFVGSFSHPVLGLTGTAAEIEAVTKAYAVYYERVPGNDGDYLINHTASVFLMGADGRFAGTIGMMEDQETRVAKLKRLIGAT